MPKPIFTALSPNTQADDVRLAAKLLLRPQDWIHGSAIRQFEKKFSKWLPSKYIFTFASGRGSLFATLKALGIGKGDQVLVQAYTCVSAVAPILWVNAQPVYVDIDKRTFNVNPNDLVKKITYKTRCLIIQHTFGQPAEIDRLLRIARKYELWVVEDCSHAMGAEYQGQKVGTFGDVAYFSLGRDKVISSVFGGIITTNNDLLADKLATIYHRAGFPTRRWIAQQLLHPIITSLVKTTYRYTYLGKLLMWLSQYFRLISKAVSYKEKLGDRLNIFCLRLPNALGILAQHQFQKLGKLNEHRKKIARIYDHQLKGMILPEKISASESIYLRYTIQTDKVKELMAVAKKQAIILGDWYQQAISPDGVSYKKIYYNPKDCPVAETVARRSINLPTHIGVTEADALRIANLITKA